MARKILIVFLAAGFLGSCRQSEKKAETPPVSAAATPQPVQAVTTPTPAADATPFLVTSSTKWKTVEEFDYQWRADQPVTHFKLEIPEGYEDPGDFIRIRIQPKGHSEFVLNSDDGWIEIANQKFPDAYTKLKEHNLVQSKYVLILPHSQNPDVPPLIFLRGWDPISPGRLRIIGWQPSGDPLLLFSEEFYLVDVNDVDDDGIKEIIGHPCFGEGTGAIGSGAGTYNPYQVYKIEIPIQKTATLSTALTEQYTRQKYDGYGGPKCSDDFITIDSKDKSKKPLVVTKEQFEKMEKTSRSAQ